MKFGEAIELVKQDILVTREGWNGKGMFIFQRPADDLPATMVINTVKSLPQSVKDYFKGRFAHTADEENAGKHTIHFTPYLCMKNAQGEIINGWVASQSDILSDDWIVFVDPDYPTI